MALQNLKVIRRTDYTPSPWLIDTVRLNFELDAEETLVTAELSLRPNPETEFCSTLTLDGENLTTVSILLNKEPARYKETPTQLTLSNLPPAPCTLQTQVKICPAKNTKLSGLYKSGDMLLTQCESQGFRRITWFLDRPDVMATYYVTLSAPKDRYSQLLSNGNCLAQRQGPREGWHTWEWYDPYPKPSYLFAIAAGNLQYREGYFTTRSGKRVTLRIFAEEKDLAYTELPMQFLKNVMRWDEEVFNLEYDLDLFQIVATPDFNAGAMENKGLNIFASSLLFCSKDISTDAQLMRVDRIIGHEYFHNYTGNRVTLRDWFQLSLKEGLTSYREGLYAGDTYCQELEDIARANTLRSAQFPEDAGTNAHPIRPESLVKVDNIYTTTVYEKGAAVLTMLEFLVGREKFTRAITAYLRKFDGKAAVLENLVETIQQECNIDLTQFHLWFSQAGTPEVYIEDSYNPESQEFTVNVRQVIPETAAKTTRYPMLIPMLIGLLDPQTGKEIPLYLNTPTQSLNGETTGFVRISQEAETFVFTNVPCKPVPSYFRRFSAPVKIMRKTSEDELMYILMHDSDGFTRWDAAKTLGRTAFFQIVETLQNKERGLSSTGLSLLEPYKRALEAVAQSAAEGKIMGDFAAELLSLPTFSWLGTTVNTVYNPVIWAEAYTTLRKLVATELYPVFLNLYETVASIDPEYKFERQAVAKRSLRALLLEYLAIASPEKLVGVCENLYNNANNLTDKIAALRALSVTGMPENVFMAYTERFKESANNNPILYQQWLNIRSSAQVYTKPLERIQELLDDKNFVKTRPHYYYAALRGLISNLRVRFSPECVQFMGKIIEQLDSINPHASENLFCSYFTQWKHYSGEARDWFKAEITRLSLLPNISPNLGEVLAKSL